MVVAQLNGESHKGIDYNTLFGKRWLSDNVRKSSAILSEIYIKKLHENSPQMLNNSKYILSLITGDKFLLQTN